MKLTVAKRVAPKQRQTSGQADVMLGVGPLGPTGRRN